MSRLTKNYSLYWLNGASNLNVVTVGLMKYVTRLLPTCGSIGVT